MLDNFATTASVSVQPICHVLVDIKTICLDDKHR